MIIFEPRLILPIQVGGNIIGRVVITRISLSPAYIRPAAGRALTVRYRHLDFRHIGVGLFKSEVTLDLQFVVQEFRRKGSRILEGVVIEVQPVLTIIKVTHSISR
jgi:hypothetical protein